MSSLDSDSETVDCTENTKPIRPMASLFVETAPINSNETSTPHDQDIENVRLSPNHGSHDYRQGDNEEDDVDADTKDDDDDDDGDDSDTDYNPNAEDVQGPEKKTPQRRERIRGVILQCGKLIKRQMQGARGEEYTNTRGTSTSARHVGQSCTCRQRCFEKVIENARMEIFANFCSLANIDTQDAYFHGLITKQEVMRRRPKEGAPTQKTHESASNYTV